MSNIKEKIAYYKFGEYSNSFTIIAKELLKDIENNKFRTIKELANASNIVESVVVSFCKKLGYTGYRELILRLKLDVKDSNNNLLVINDKFNEFKNSVFNLIKSIDKYQKDILEIIDLINETNKTIYIFSDSTYESEAFLFSQWLSLKNISNKIMIYSVIIYQSIKTIESESIIFWIIDNKVEILKKVNKYLSTITNNQIVILTEKIEEKVNSKYIIELTKQNDPRSYVYFYKYLLSYVISQILYQIKRKK